MGGFHEQRWLICPCSLCSHLLPTPNGQGKTPSRGNTIRLSLRMPHGARGCSAVPPGRCGEGRCTGTTQPARQAGRAAGNTQSWGQLSCLAPTGAASELPSQLEPPTGKGGVDGKQPETAVHLYFSYFPPVCFPTRRSTRTCHKGDPQTLRMSISIHTTSLDIPPPLGWGRVSSLGQIWWP